MVLRNSSSKRRGVFTWTDKNLVFFFVIDWCSNTAACGDDISAALILLFSGVCTGVSSLVCVGTTVSSSWSSRSSFSSSFSSSSSERSHHVSTTIAFRFFRIRRSTRVSSFAATSRAKCPLHGPEVGSNALHSTSLCPK